MKRKELKQIAKQLAELERQLQEGTNTEDEERKYKIQVLEICSKVSNLDDMMIIDEMVQELLS